jgi:SAM-dependent methyltransferase
VPPDPQDLTARESHFAFGANWASYASTVAEPQIQAAVAGLQRLVGDRIAGRRFLDIGCGSGIHSLAALRLGAAEVVAVDIDTDSVATAQRMLEANARGGRWRTAVVSVFDLSPADFGHFDVVYSWGVLHHTGDMYRAVRCAAALVGPGGAFALALYRKTRCCGLWKVEKRWYARASRRSQRMTRALYLSAFRLALALRGGSWRSHVLNYNERGMDLEHDVHDWLGGWPYESISPAETEQLMSQIGLHRVRAFLQPQVRFGLFGSGCDEYVYARE